MKEGAYPYAIVPAHSGRACEDRPFKIKAKGKGSKMKQHNIVIEVRDGRFVPSDAELEINAGDLVLWNCVDNNAAYAILGDADFFSSDRLVNECGFSHAFGNAGEYRWADAYGSGLSGRVRVSAPHCVDNESLKAWQGRLAEGVLVMIEGGQAKPAEVEVLVGQTLFFAVTTSSGISITDERLLKLPKGADYVEQSAPG
jgi:plastocyanin